MKFIFFLLILKSAFFIYGFLKKIVFTHEKRQNSYVKSIFLKFRDGNNNLTFYFYFLFFIIACLNYNATSKMIWPVLSAFSSIKGRNNGMKNSLKKRETETAKVQQRGSNIIPISFPKKPCNLILQIKYKKFYKQMFLR